MSPYENFCADDEQSDVSVLNTITIELPLIRDINELVNTYLARSFAKDATYSYSGQKIWVVVKPHTTTMEIDVNVSEDATESETGNGLPEASVNVAANMEVDERDWPDYGSSDTSDSEMDLELVKEIKPSTTLHYFPNEIATRSNDKRSINLGPTLLKFQGNLIVLNPRSGRLNLGATDQLVFTVKEASTIYFEEDFRYEVFQHDGYHGYMTKIVYRHPKDDEAYGLLTVFFLLKYSQTGVPSAQISMFVKPHTQMAIHVNEM